MQDILKLAYVYQLTQFSLSVKWGAALPSSHEYVTILLLNVTLGLKFIKEESYEPKKEDVHTSANTR